MAGLISIAEYIITPRASLKPSPDMPIGIIMKFTILNKENISNTFMKFVLWPNDKNNKYSKAASNIVLIIVIKLL